MWRRENQGLYERKGARYPSDLRDAEWVLMAPLIPPGERGRRHLEADAREEFGHWEGNLLRFRTQCDHFLILCDRITRLTLAAPLKSKAAEASGRL